MPQDASEDDPAELEREHRDVMRAWRTSKFDAAKLGAGGDGYARYEDAEEVATQMIDVNGDGVADADDLSAILDVWFRHEPH